MSRPQVYLGAKELELLERASAGTGASRSELIRRATAALGGPLLHGINRCVSEGRAALRALVGPRPG